MKEIKKEFDRKIEEGLEDMREGRINSHDEIKKKYLKTIEPNQSE